VRESVFLTHTVLSVYLSYRLMYVNIRKIKYDDAAMMIMMMTVVVSFSADHYRV